jgi:hypothetical protein
MREFYGELAPERDIYVPSIREELDDLSNDFRTPATPEDEEKITND